MHARDGVLSDVADDQDRRDSREESKQVSTMGVVSVSQGSRASNLYVVMAIVD
jgi:hypothetical protein